MLVFAIAFAYLHVETNLGQSKIGKKTLQAHVAKPPYGGVSP